MSKFRLIAAALSVISAPAAAQIVFENVPVQIQPEKASPVKSDWDKIECRSEDVLGSRLEKNKVCLTKWQWWTFEQEEKQRLQQWQIVGYATNH